MRLTHRATTLVLAMTVALVLAACSPPGPPESSQAGGGRVPWLDYGAFANSTAPQANYNPYSPNGLGANPYIYEPLMAVNTYDCEPTPWLATEYEWKDPKTLVFTIREGVAWSDGEPFTAEDAAFTFTMLKQHPALDTTGATPTLESATAEGNTVVITLTQPDASVFTNLATVKIVPEHIWSKQADPVAFTAPEAIGTGPMLVKSFNPEQLTIARNPDYWQADKVQVEEIRFHSSESGQVDQLKLSRGEFDHNAMFVPDIEETYVQRDPEHHHYWYPPGGVISLYMNLTRAPFDDLKFRQAMTFAIDKDRIAEEAQFGYVETASQTGLVLPNQEDWLAPDVENQGKLPYDPDRADQLLTEAGYDRNAEGRRLGADGKPMTFTFQVPSGWSDWITAVKIIKENLADLGIQVDVESPANPIVENNRALGSYDLQFGVFGGTCNMWRNYADPLAGEYTAPIGEKARSNAIRWQDARTDELLAEMRTVSDVEQQKELVHDLQRIMLEQVPMVPLWYGAQWFQYSTKKAEGWPNADNPYAGPANQLLIITHLRPAGADS